MKKLETFFGTLFLLSLVVFGACKKTKNPNEGTMLGTIISVACGYSDIGHSLWIKGEDGKIYQPCVNDAMKGCVGIAADEKFYAGDLVRFGYRNLKANESCPIIRACDRLVTEPDKKIALTSIRVEKASGISKQGVIKDYSKLDGCGFVFETEDGSKYEISEWNDVGPIMPNEPVEIFFAASNNSVSTCMVGQLISCRNVMYLRP
ncbi:MAG: hypothetical protein SGJ00_15100 [bacterium]|nr:hypothetical protein [bacterium]